MKKKGVAIALKKAATLIEEKVYGNIGQWSNTSNNKKFSIKRREKDHFIGYIGAAGSSGEKSWCGVSLLQKRATVKWRKGSCCWKVRSYLHSLKELKSCCPHHSHRWVHNLWCWRSRCGVGEIIVAKQKEGATDFSPLLKERSNHHFPRCQLERKPREQSRLTTLDVLKNFGRTLCKTSRQN